MTNNDWFDVLVISLLSSALVSLMFSMVHTCK